MAFSDKFQKEELELHESVHKLLQNPDTTMDSLCINIYQNSFIKLNEKSETYDDLSLKFINSVNHTFITPAIHTRIIEFINNHNITRILDIGCGFGYITGILNHNMTKDKLTDKTFRCIPVDIKDNNQFINHKLYKPFVNDIKLLDSVIPKEVIDTCLDEPNEKYCLLFCYSRAEDWPYEYFIEFLKKVGIFNTYVILIDGNTTNTGGQRIENFLTNFRYYILDDLYINIFNGGSPMLIPKFKVRFTIKDNEFGNTGASGDQISCFSSKQITDIKRDIEYKIGYYFNSCFQKYFIRSYNYNHQNRYNDEKKSIRKNKLEEKNKDEREKIEMSMCHNFFDPLLSSDLDENEEEEYKEGGLNYEDDDVYSSTKYMDDYFAESERYKKHVKSKKENLIKKSFEQLELKGESLNELIKKNEDIIKQQGGNNKKTRGKSKVKAKLTRKHKNKKNTLKKHKTKKHKS
jgi:hypothetical protein